MTGREAAAVVGDSKELFGWSDADAASWLYVSVSAIEAWRTDGTRLLRGATAAQVRLLERKNEARRKKDAAAGE